MISLQGNDKISYLCRLFYSVSENPLHNQTRVQIHSFIHSSNIYCAPTLFKGLCSAGREDKDGKIIPFLSRVGRENCKWLIAIKDYYFNEVFMYKVNVGEVIFHGEIKIGSMKMFLGEKFACAVESPLSSHTEEETVLVLYLLKYKEGLLWD